MLSPRLVAPATWCWLPIQPIFTWQDLALGNQLVWASRHRSRRWERGQPGQHGPGSTKAHGPEKSNRRGLLSSPWASEAPPARAGGRSLWLHGENMDPGVEQVVGRSYGHADPTSWHCLLPLGTYWSHPIPRSSSQRFYKGSFRCQCPGNPSGTNSGYLQSIQACVPSPQMQKNGLF